MTQFRDMLPGLAALVILATVGVVVALGKLPLADAGVLATALVGVWMIAARITQVSSAIDNHADAIRAATTPANERPTPPDAPTAKT